MDRHASLNRIYRLVWSHVHKTWVVVAETARGRGKGANRAKRKLLLAAAVSGAAHLAQAGPTGGQVTAGTGAIQQSGNTTTINQSSQNLSLSWQSFNTNGSETVNFVQPSSSAIAVNRIFDTNGTQFMGRLNANGQVYLINPNGVLFGAGSQVNVGGLVASTLDVDDAAASGAARRFSGAGTGGIVNQGSITAANGGYVAFIGNRVSNQGTIAAPQGAVALGAGRDVTLSFAGNSLVQMQVNQSTLDNLAENRQLIQADGGAVILTAGAKDAVLASVVNNTGVIQARSVQNVNGTIVLGGGAQSTVTNGGTLDASGSAAGQHGGTVKVLGDGVNLAAGSAIDVSGDAGGGTALVGGNFHGDGAERNALNTTVAAGAVIDADAVNAGNGGQVAVWSNGTTHFDGAISARGGRSGGDGGQIETSGHTLKVGASAKVDTSAGHGVAGNWLLDPADITIGSVADMGYAFPNIDVDSAALTTALNNGNVTIKTTASNPSCTSNVSCGGGSGTHGDIILLDTIGNAVSYYDPDHTAHMVQWDTNNYTLTLSAYRNIRFAYSENYFSPGGNITYSAGGSIDTTNNPMGGNVVLKADNSATGTGTVIMDRTDGWNYFAFGSPSSKIDIYYNQDGASPKADYSQYLFAGYGSASQIVQHMALNVTAAISDKTYDGSRTGNIGSVSVSGAYSGDDVAIDHSHVTATFDTKDAGVNKTVTIDGIGLSGSAAGQYYLNGLDSQTATITKATLTVGGVTANNKVYDGTNAATLSGTAAVSALAGDAVSVTGSASAAFIDKNAGFGKQVTVGGYTLSGADAGNYNIVQPQNLFANIAKADVAVTGVSANTKIYDRTTGATLSGNPTVAAFGSDVVSVSSLGSASASFADKNAGSNKAVTVSGFTLSGTDAGNYNLVQPSGVTGTILQASLQLTGLSVSDKFYDGTTSATLSGSAAVTPIAGDVVSVSGSGSAVFTDKNAGFNKTVNVGGFTLSGADAANYSLAQSGGLTGNIAKTDLAISGVSANNKTYDGTTAATLSGTAVVSAIGGDVVAVAGSGSGSFDTKDAGTGKRVSVGGYTLVGLDAANYNAVQPQNLFADIAKADLAVTGVSVNNKTYDGTTAATVSGTASVAAFGADAVSVSGTASASASFRDKNAGSGKLVDVGGFTLSGADAGNYNLVQPSGLRADIAKADLLLGGLAVADKVYDGTTVATLTGSAGVQAIGGDDVSVSGTGSAVFADKNAGVGKAVNVSGYTLAGLDAANYNLVQVGGLSASIARADLAIAGVTANNKTYDGTTAATLSGSASVTAIGADAVTVSGTGTGSFADKNAGTGKLVNVSGFTLSGADAANYNAVQPAGLSADIGKADLAVIGISANNKTYDGATAATLSGNATVAAFGADAVSVSGSGTASFADKNAGSGKAVTVNGFTLSGLDAANYNVVQPSGLTATINKANLQVTGISVSDKVYDGTTAATIAGVGSVTAIGGDDVSLTGSASAMFADKNAGANKAVNVSGLTLSGADAGNYRLVQVGGLTANIDRADLAIAGVSANNKVYDGTTAATLSGFASVSPIGADDVTLAGSASGVFASKNAGAGKAVSVSGFTLGGLDAANYNLVQPAGLSADIARADLAVSGVSANNKTYDGTTAATLSGNATVAAFGADAVAVSGSGSATFADRNAGSGKAVSVSGFTLSGADAANYNIVQPSGLSASINKANLQLTGIAVGDKVYDGTTAATLSGSASVTPIGGDDVSLSGSASAVFADKNAGANKAVNVSGYALSGADAGNYNLVQVGGLTANIGRADLAVSGVSANGKVYDGTVAATLSGTAGVSAIGADQVALGGAGTASFADKNAGSGKQVNVSGYTLTGLDAGNYNLVQPAGLRADVARADLAISGVTANNKTYDGSTAATLSGTATVAAFGADAVALSGAGTARFADKNAGSAKGVTVSGYTLSGADAANYNVVQPAGLSADIGKATLAVSGVSANGKTYDGTTAATLSGTASVAAIAGDAVVLNGRGTASFADKNAGSAKRVTVSGYALGGADAGNYTLVQPAGLAADIGKAALAVSGVSANNKTYDGTIAATLSGTASVAAIAGDAVALGGAGTASFADKNAGSAKRVTVAGYTLSGADAGNYSLVQPAGLSAGITPATITVSGIGASDKAFDGTVAATVSTAGALLKGKVDGDAVTLASTGVFADGAAGLNKAVKLSNVYGGADLANYTIVDQAMAQASITQKPQQIDNAVAQVQSTVLASQASAQPTLLNTSSTVLVSRSEGDGPSTDDSKGYPGSGAINTTLGFGPGAPKLQIQNGGMRLPTLATGITQ
jgi:filamentous hemagglutinin family protein